VDVWDGLSHPGQFYQLLRSCSINLLSMRPAGPWRILHAVQSFIFILASVQPACVVWVLMGSPGSGRSGLAGWVAVGREACGKRPPVAGRGEQPWWRPPSLPPGKCLGLSPVALPSPAAPLGICWESQQSEAGRCVSLLAPCQCTGLVTEKDGGLVPPTCPGFWWGRGVFFCRFIIAL